MKKNLFFSLAAFIMVFLTGCQNNKPRYQSISLDETPEVDLEIHRYEQVLFATSPDNLATDVKEFQDTFSFFLGTDQINEQQLIRLKNYISDPALISLYQKAREKYPDNIQLQESLSPLLRYYKYYFPQAITPSVYTYISGIDYQHPVFVADSLIIVAIDMYLGSDFNAYTKAGIPAYKRKHNTQVYLPVDIAEQLARQELANPVAQGRFLERIIHHGKVLYFKDAMLPAVNDSVKVKYTKEQLEWVEQNEKMIWSFIVENELLFSGRYDAYKKLLSDGPFTAEFGRESAPRIGHWIGWQIVRDYMETNPSVTLNDLLDTKDVRTILDASGYKP